MVGKMRQKVQLREKVRLRRRKKIRFIISICALTGLAGFGTVKGYHYLLRSPYLTLQEIKIEGSELFSSPDIFRWCSFRQGENILKIDLGRIKRKLQVFPQIKKISIQRNLPHQIEIRIQERIPIGLIKNSNKVYVFDSEGVTFPYNFSKDKPLVLPRVTGISQGQKEQLIKVGEIIDKINLFALFEKKQIAINMSDCENPIIQTKAFGEIRLGPISSDNLQSKFEYLARVIADLRKKGQTTKYIDLRFFENSRDSIYVKPRKKL